MAQYRLFIAKLQTLCPTLTGRLRILMMTATDETGGAGHYTQATALKDIVRWSEQRPDWQRDALRQLISAENADEIDVDRLESICVGEIEEFDALEDADIAQETSAGESVAISKLHSLQGVNALVEQQELDIDASGITIIYGDNGSGKSGYCRVLKHACRSRDNKFEIHPNIDGPSDAAQTATIDYTTGTTTKTVLWSPEGGEISELSKVSIFDSRSANTHVQNENSVAYTPFPMRVLEGLGELCDNLKARLETRISNIESQTPLAVSNHQFAEDTSAGKFLNELSAKSDPEVLELLCKLSDEEKHRLETLKSDLSQDPQKAIRNLTAQKQRVEGVISMLERLSGALSVESVKKHRDLAKALETAQLASKAASESLFEASPLPDIGSDAWKALWEAARNFSDHVVYPDKSFPEAVADDDLCVLCQQPLSEEAIERRLTFENFVKSTTKTQESDCQKTLEEDLLELKSHIISVDALDAATTFLSEELSKPELAEKVRTWVDGSNERLNALLLNEDDKPVEARIPIDELTTLRDEFGARTVQLQSVQDPEARAKLELEKRDLEARVGIGAIKSDLLAQIDRLKDVAGLRKTLKTTTRQSVTNKNKELSELLVTGALRDRFAREITKLDLNATPMELRKTRDRKAQSYFQVEFVRYPGQPLGDILSEGEHRCVALAAFLAELVTSQDKSGIVFDDPMSSLDHIYRERVARRLAEEAQHRQVVIFTHDLGFLFEVNREAEKVDIPVKFQHVKRKSNAPGFVTDDLPLKARTAPSRVAALRSELKEIKGQLVNASEIKRVILTKGIIEQCREAWDQVIADFISPVLGRFDNKIAGSSLFKLLVLTQADVELITAARSRLSEDLHNAAGALNPEEVTHEQLSAEVTVIHDFIEDLKKRPRAAEPRVRMPV